MKYLLILVILCGCGTSEKNSVVAGASSAPSATYSDEKIASAIFVIEGGEKTNFPYGIKSILNSASKSKFLSVILPLELRLKKQIPISFWGI